MDRRLIRLVVAGALLVAGTALAQQNVPALQPAGPTVADPRPAAPLTSDGRGRAGVLDQFTRQESLAAARAERPLNQKPGTGDPGVALGAAEQRDSVTVGEYLQTQRAYYRFRAASYAYTLRVFEWQQLSSQLIFALVLLLVLAGLYFSWLQFQDDMRHRDLVDRLRADARRLTAARTPAAASATAPPAAAAGPGDAAPADDLPAQHHLKLGTSGIEVSSSVLGIIILVLSLGFFYLYLVYVYPISEVK